MSFTISGSLSAPTLKSSKSFVDDNKDFTLTGINNITIVSTGGDTTGIINDVQEITQSDPTLYNEPQISVETSDFIQDPLFTSLNTSVATIDSAGRTTRVTNGMTNIIVDINGYKKSIEVDVTQNTPSTQVVSSSFLTGSLGADAANNVDSKIVGKNQNDHGFIFTSQNHSTDTFIRNTNVWCYDYDLTCISPSNSNSNARKAGTLLTPRHIGIAAHYEYGVGTNVYFVSQDGNNTVYERTVVSKVRHPEYSPYFPDITICCLDSDLPSDKIKHCKVLPSNWSNYLVETEKGRPPSLSLDQEEKALITDLYEFTTMARFAAPQDDTRLLFYETKISGDSGNPSFLILDLGNGPELILLTLWTYGSAGSGTFITPQISDINAMIVTADTQAENGGTGYTLDEADLSGFTDFS
jgi:hypothetical protein